MAAERTQYLLPEGLGVDAVVELLAAQFDIESDRIRSTERRFYDTFDGRLHAAELVLTHEDGRLLLADATGYRRGWADQRSAPRKLFAGDLSPGPVHELLEPIVKVRALTPLARVRSRLRLVRVLDDEGKTVVRLAVEEPLLAGTRQTVTRLGPRVRVMPVRGYDEALAHVRRTLEREVGLIEAGVSLQDEAVAAAGGIPGGVSSKLEVNVRSSERADRATATALAGPLAAIEANLPGTLGDVDSEFLHDLRVAVRRTRALQRQLRSVFPREPLDHFRGEFRWLQQVTGPVRDLDVHLSEIEAYRETRSADLGPLSEVLAAKRRTEFGRMARALRSKRTNELLAGWASLVEELPTAPAEDRPDARAQIGDVAGARIRSVYRRMVKMGRKIDSESPPEALHNLRKKGKELRYLLEFFAGIYPSEVVKPMVRRLKVLQDVLGRYQDREVQAGMLRSLRHEVGGLEGGPAALMAMGLLADGLEREQAAARKEFGARCAPFAAKKQRWLVDETFG